MSTEEQEEAYLRKLYEMTEVDELGHDRIFAIGEKRGYDRDLTDEITRQLEENGLVEGLSVAGTIYITSKGKLKARGVNRESDKTAKKEIHQDLRNAFADIVRMISCGLIGGENSPWKDDIWRKDFPKHEVKQFFEQLVKMFGDEYAIEIAEGIESGLRTRQYLIGESADIFVEVVRRPHGFR